MEDKHRPSETRYALSALGTRRDSRVHRLTNSLLVAKGQYTMEKLLTHTLHPVCSTIDWSDTHCPHSGLTRKILTGCEEPFFNGAEVFGYPDCLACCAFLSDIAQD